MSAEGLTIKFLKLTRNNLESQLVTNSEELNLRDKYRSNDLSELEAQFTQEADLIKNEMAQIDDKDGNEYESLMAELEELRDEYDRDQNKIEEETTSAEESVQVENSLIETQLQAVNQDIETYTEMRKQNIEDNFSYFQ